MPKIKNTLKRKSKKSPHEKQKSMVDEDGKQKRFHFFNISRKRILEC